MELGNEYTPSQVGTVMGRRGFSVIFVLGTSEDDFTWRQNRCGKGRKQGELPTKYVGPLDLSCVLC